MTTHDLRVLQMILIFEGNIIQRKEILILFSNL